MRGMFKELAEKMGQQAGDMNELKKQVSQIAKDVYERRDDKGKLPSQTIPNPRQNVSVIAIKDEEEMQAEGKEKEQGLDSASVEYADASTIKARTPDEFLENQETSADENKETCAEFPVSNSQFLNSNPLAQLPFPMQVIERYEAVNNGIQRKECEDTRTNAKIQELEQGQQGALTNRTRDPGAFTVTCGIGNTLIPHCLIDLGASINVMPYDLFCSLQLGPVKPIKLTIELGNKSCVHPYGLLENLTLNVGEVVVPADFYVLQMEDTQTKESPTLILGRPILFATKAKIDVAEGIIMLKYGGKMAEFRVFEDDHQPCAGKPPEKAGKSCFNNITAESLRLIQGVSEQLKVTRKTRPPDEKRVKKQKCGVGAQKWWTPTEKNWRSKPPDGGRSIEKRLTCGSAEERSTLSGKFDLEQPWDPNL